MFSNNYIPGTYLEEISVPDVKVPALSIPKVNASYGSAGASISPYVDYQPLPYDHLADMSRPEEDRSEFVKGVLRNIDTTQASLYGAAGLVGDLVGADSLRDWGYEGYTSNMKEAEQNAARVGSVDQISSFGDAWDWGMGTLGELSSTVAQIFATGGTASVLAKTAGSRMMRKAIAEGIENQTKKNIADAAARGLAGEAVEKAARDAATKQVTSNLARTWSQYSTTGLMSGIESGSNWGQDITEHGAGNTNPGLDLMFGVLSGVSEAILGAETSLFRQLTGKTVSDTVERKFRDIIIKELPKAAVKEGGQEAFQEMLSAINMNIQESKGLITTEDLSDLVNSFFAGALGGAVLNVPSSIKQVRDSKKASAERAKLEKQKAEIEAAKLKAAETAATDEQKRADALAGAQDHYTQITDEMADREYQWQHELDSFEDNWWSEPKNAEIKKAYTAVLPILSNKRAYSDTTVARAEAIAKKYAAATSDMNIQKRRRNQEIENEKRVFYANHRMQVRDANRFPEERTLNPYAPITGFEERTLPENVLASAEPNTEARAKRNDPTRIANKQMFAEQTKRTKDQIALESNSAIDIQFEEKLKQYAEAGQARINQYFNYNTTGRKLKPEEFQLWKDRKQSMELQLAREIEQRRREHYAGKKYQGRSVEDRSYVDWTGPDLSNVNLPTNTVGFKPRLSNATVKRASGDIDIHAGFETKLAEKEAEEKKSAFDYYDYHVRGAAGKKLSKAERQWWKDWLTARYRSIERDVEATRREYYAGKKYETRTIEEPFGTELPTTEQSPESIMQEGMETRNTMYEQWSEYADSERARFKREWDARGARINSRFAAARRAMQSERIPTQATRQEFAAALAEHSKYVKERKQEEEALEKRLQGGYRSADGTLVAASRQAAEVESQRKQQDKLRGEGIYDAYTEAVDAATTYHDKVQTTIDDRIGKINQSIADIKAKILDGQKNLTLTNSKYQALKKRLNALNKERAKAIRSKSKLKKLMNDILNMPSNFNVKTLNDYGIKIQELYHEGDSILDVESFNDIFMDNAEVRLSEIKDNYRKLLNNIKKTSTSVGKLDNPIAQQTKNVLDTVSNNFSGIDFDRDYTLQNPDSFAPTSEEVEETKSIDFKSIGEDRADSQYIDDSVTSLTESIQQEQQEAVEQQEEQQQNEDLMKQTGQKTAKIPEESLNTIRANMQRDINAAIDSAKSIEQMVAEEQKTQQNLATNVIANKQDSAVTSVINFLKNTLKALPGLKDNTVICYDENDASLPVELKNMLANINLGLTKGVKYLFCGTTGSYNLDIAGEMYTRSDNYLTAELMEAEGKDPRTIKLATGWERNKADGLWRYEISDKDFTFDSSIPELNDVEAFNSKGYTLEQILSNAEDLFIAYPELKDYKVSLMKFDGSTYGSFNTSTKMVELADALSTSEKTLTLLHEIQHAIQHIEGFNSGTSEFSVNWKRYGADKDNATRIKRMRSLFSTYSYISRYLSKDLYSIQYKFNEIFSKVKDENLALNDEISSDLNTLSEVLSKLDSLDRDTLTYIDNLALKLIEAIKVFRDSIPYVKELEYSNKLISLQVELDVYVHGRTSALLKNLSKVDRLKNIFNKFKDYADPNLYQDSYTVYKRRAGETEARNVQRRHNLSYEERLKSLIEDTQDIAYEDQQTMYRAMNGQVKGVYYNGKLYIFAKNMDSKEDAIRTLIHEGVAHYGLRSIMNDEQLGQFLNLVFNSFAGTESWKKFAAARPEYFKTNDRLTQAEEYVAWIAEQMKVKELINPENQSIFNRIIMFLRGVLSKLGLNTTLTHKDIRDVLKLAAHHLQQKADGLDIRKELSNIDMYQSDQQTHEMPLSEEPIFGVKFDDVMGARVYFANADAAKSGIPYTRYAKNDPNLSNTMNLNDSINKQPEKIKTRLSAIIKDFGIEPSIDVVDNENIYVNMFNKEFGPFHSIEEVEAFIREDRALESVNGWDVYNYLAKLVGTKKSTTEILNSYGIRGAQYLNNGKNTYYLFEGNNINTVPYQYDLNKLSEPKFLVTNPKDMVLDPETGEPTTKDTPDQWTYMNELFNQPARESSWLRKVASVIKTGTSRADDGSLIEHNGWERFIEGTVDRYRRLKVVQDYLKKKFKGAVNFTTNVYQNLQGLTNRISERQVDAANKYLKPVEDVLKEITVDLPIYKDGKLVGYKKSTDSDYQDFLLRLFDGFLHARHAQERNKSVSERFRGRRWLDKDGNPHHKNMKSAEQGQDIINASGMSDAEAQHLIDTLGSISGFQEAAALVDKMNRYTLETMLEMKLITQEDFNNMAKYNYYVPLTGWEDMIEHFAPGRYRPRGRSLSTGGKRPVQFAKGRDNKLPSSPLLRSWQQMDDIIALGMRNEVMRGFGQLVKNTSSETELWEVDRKNPEAVRLQVTKDGDIILVTKPSELHGSGDAAVSYIDENGKPVRIVIKDKWLADAMRGENMAPTGVIIDMMRKYTGMMSKLMTSRNPLFTLVNPIRDLTTAYLNLGSVIEENQMRGLMEKNGVIQNSVIKEAFAGNIRSILFDLAMADEGKKPFDASKYDPQIVQDVMDWRKNGGHTKSISVYDMQDRSKALRANIRKDGIMKRYDDAMKYLDILSDTAENIVRFSVYRNVQRAFEENIHQRAKAEGWSSTRVQQEIEMAKQKSANIALDCTVNFTKRGAWANVYNPLFAFSSASIQGFARIANNLWRPTSTPLQNFKRVSKFMAMGTCAPLMHGFICRAIMGDDEDGLNKYDKIPAYIKETNLIIPMPFGDGGYIKIPLPYGYNVFWSMGTTLDTVMAGHQHPADGALSIMKNALSNITPLDPSQGAVAFVPTIFKPLVELAANKNFAGAPIKPEGYSTDMLPEHMKAWERTPKGYKDVAGMLNFITGGFMTKSNIGALDISPETIEHLANSYLGGLYRIFSQSLDLALSPMMGYQVEAKNIPLLNRLYGVSDDDNTRAIYNRYADHVRSAQVLKKQLKGTEDERDLLDSRRNVFSVEKQYTAVNTELNKVKQAKKDLAKRYPKRGEAYYNQLKLLEKREEKIMQKFNRVAHRAGLTME